MFTKVFSVFILEEDRRADLFSTLVTGETRSMVLFILEGN